MGSSPSERTTNAEYQARWRERHPELHRQRIAAVNARGVKRKLRMLDIALDNSVCVRCGGHEALRFLKRDGTRSDLRKLAHRRVGDERLQQALSKAIVMCESCYQGRTNHVSSRRREELLGMPFGTAQGRLRKTIMFKLASDLGLNCCYRCGDTICTVDEFTIEHKRAWLSSGDAKLYWDLDNIAFSHGCCNVRGI